MEITTTIKVDHITNLKLLEKADKPLSYRYIVSYYDNRMISIKIWNELASNPPFCSGDTLGIILKIDSKENNGNFYTDLTISKILFHEKSKTEIQPAIITQQDSLTSVD